MKLITLIMLAMLTFSVNADTVYGSFTAPTTRVDGTALSIDEIGGYDVYVDKALVETISNISTTYTVEALPGEHVITIITFDTEGRYSLPSNEILVEVKSHPKAPRLDAASVVVTPSTK